MPTITRAIWLLLPLLVVGASLTVVSSEEMRAGVVTALQGTAKVTRASLTGPRDLGFKDDVYVRDEIVTGDASMARILLGGKALLTVRERSIVKITETPGVSTVGVSSGRAAVNVMKDRMRAGDSVEIVTPNATAAIRGTIVVAEVDSDAGETRSTITVLRGLIDVTQHDASGRPLGQPVSVGALQQVTVSGRQLSPVQTISRPVADRLTNDFKMGLRSAPGGAPSLVQSEVDRAVQQFAATKDSAKDSAKDSGDKSADSSKGDSKTTDAKSGDSKSSDGKSGDTRTAGSGNAGSGNAGSGNAGTGNAGSGNAGSGNAGTGGGSGNAGGSGSGGNTGGGNERVASGGSNNGGGPIDRVGGGGNQDRDRDRDKGNKDRGGKKR